MKKIWSSRKSICGRSVQEDCRSEKHLRDNWLDFGKYNGIRQWRNGSNGYFTWGEVE